MKISLLKNFLLVAFLGLSFSQISHATQFRYIYGGEGEISLEELLKNKKGVLLDFYAVWCGPCMASMPKLQEKARKLRPQGVEVVAVKVDDKDNPRAKVFRDEENIHWVMEDGS